MEVLPTSLYRWAVSAITLVVCKLVVDKVISIRAAFARVKDCPGRIPLWVKPFGPIALVLGTTFPRPGMGGYYAARFTLYRKFKSTTFASVDIAAAQPIFWSADPEALKLVTSDRHTFPKDVTQYEVLNFCGGNLVSLEGPDWKRHRQVAMSAFNEANVALAWSEALRVANEWFEQLDSSGSDVTVNLVQSMEQATILIIASAGFGIRMSWIADPDAQPPPGCKLPFRSAFMDSASSVIFRSLAPDWSYQFLSLVRVPYLSSYALRSKLAFEDLRTHMLDLVASACAEVTSGEPSGASGTSLLRNLVEANLNQEGASKRLTEGEVLSNVFVVLLAGHETTAHALSFAFVLLALYPECQKKVYEEVIRVWPADVPVAQMATNHKEHVDKLEYTLACLRETLRLYPPVPRVSKDVYKDSILPGTHFTPGSKEGPSVETGKFTMAIPAGSLVAIDIWGLHMNPLYWGEDAEEYKPERFIDTETYQWPRTAFLPFSGGPRSCIGQRFALAEALATIASVVRRYVIRIPDDLAKKTFEEQREALLRWKTGITIAPTNARVTLCRRI